MVVACGVGLSACGTDAPSLEEQLREREQALEEAAEAPKTAEELYTPIDEPPDEALVGELVVDVQPVQPGVDGRIDLDQFAGIETVNALSRAVTDAQSQNKRLAEQVRTLEGAMYDLRGQVALTPDVPLGDGGIPPYELLPPGLEELYEPEESWRAELTADLALVRQLALYSQEYQTALDSLSEADLPVKVLSELYPEVGDAHERVSRHLEAYHRVLGTESEDTGGSRSLGVVPKLVFADGEVFSVRVDGAMYTLRADSPEVTTAHGALRVVSTDAGTLVVSLDGEPYELRL